MQLDSIVWGFMTGGYLQISFPHGIINKIHLNKWGLQFIFRAQSLYPKISHSLSHSYKIDLDSDESREVFLVSDLKVTK